MKKTNTGFAWSRLLCCLLALVMVMGMALTGCKKESAGGKDADGIVLGDGDGKLEPQDAVDSVTSIYGTLLDTITGGKKPSNTTDKGGMNMEMGLTIGQYVLDMLSAQLEKEGTPMDVQWMNKISVSTDMCWDGDRSNVLAQIKINGTTIYSVDTYADMENFMFYSAFPEMSDQFLGVQVDMDMIEDTMKDILPYEISSMIDWSVLDSLGSLGDYDALMEQYGDLINDVIKALPSEGELNSILSRYLDAMLGVLGKPESSQVTLSYGGISQQVTADTYVINRSDLVDMVVKVLKTARKDGQLEKVINRFSKWFNKTMEEQMGFFWEDIDMHTYLIEGIDMLLDQYEGIKDNLHDEELMRYTVYTSGKEQVGYKVSMAGMDVLYCYSLTSGENSAYVMNMGDQMQIAGTSTTTGGKTNGTYTVTVEGLEYVVLEVKDFDTAAMERGDLKGTVRIRIGEGLRDQMGYVNAMVADAVFEIVMDMAGDVANLAFNVYTGETLLGGIYFKTNLTEGKKITMPSKYVDINDIYALQDYLASASPDKILENLREAGVPDELMDMLEKELVGG